MKTLIIFLISISNLAWVYAFLTFALTGEQVASLTRWLPGVTPASFANYTIIALLIALVAQVMLALGLYGVLHRSSHLSTKYKQMKVDHKDSKSKISQQEKDLKNASTVEEKNKILKERVIGLEALNKQLETQADMMQTEQKQLAKQVEKLSKQHDKDIKAKHEPSMIDSAKSLLDKFKK
jgi:uncharacterized protein HemX